VSAGLFLKSLRHASLADPGFDPRNVLIAGVDLTPNGYDAARGRVAIREMKSKLAALPGISVLSTVRSVPLGLMGASASGLSWMGTQRAKTKAS
jgi:hypothetical protein